MRAVHLVLGGARGTALAGVGTRRVGGSTPRVGEVGQSGFRCLRGRDIADQCAVRSTQRHMRAAGRRIPAVPGGKKSVKEAAGRAARSDNATAASEEQRVTDMDNDQTSDEVTVETTSVFRADFLNELDAPAQTGSRERGIRGRRTSGGLGVAGRQTGTERRIALPARPAHHVGRPASRQRHLPRRRDRQPSSRRIPVGKQRIPRRRCRQPQRHLRQPRARGFGRAGKR